MTNTNAETCVRDRGIPLIQFQEKKRTIVSTERGRFEIEIERRRTTTREEDEEKLTHRWAARSASRCNCSCARRRASFNCTCNRVNTTQRQTRCIIPGAAHSGRRSDQPAWVVAETAICTIVLHVYRVSVRDARRSDCRTTDRDSARTYYCSPIEYHQPYQQCGNQPHQCIVLAYKRLCAP